MIERAVILAPAAAHPRFHRRVAALVNGGFEATVYAFSRGYYRDNVFAPGTTVIDLGPVADGAYLRRVPTLLRAALTVRRNERVISRGAAVTYAFGMDCAALSIAAGLRGSLIYEVGDLRNPEPDLNAATRALWTIERHVVARASLLVATSPRFLSDYYEERLGGDMPCTLLLENRLPLDFTHRWARPAERTQGSPLRLGVIGLLRYEATLAPLLKWASSHSTDVEIHVHGDGPLAPFVQRAAAVNDNVHYHGPFRNPEDLSAIYGSIDVCYCVYDTRDRNVRLALPNKLFEAPYFGVPLIVSAGTALGARVRELGIGVTIDPEEPHFLRNLLEQLADGALQKMSGAALALPTSALVENHDGLTRALHQILAR